MWQKIAGLFTRSDGYFSSPASKLSHSSSNALDVIRESHGQIAQPTHNGIRASICREMPFELLGQALALRKR